MNTSKFLSVMADESSDVSTTEQLAVCIRYLQKKKVVEAFLGFIELPRTDAATITDALLDHLQKWGLILDRLRGMGFDGASTMSGVNSGVQARITRRHPKAKYFTHCSSHCLNLVIVASCNKVQEIRNFMTSFQELTLFFAYSPKRKDILKNIMAATSDADDLLADCPKEEHEEGLHTSGKNRQSLPVLSDTRWLSRVDSISTLLVNYSKIYDAVTEVMAQSTGKSSHDASGFLHAMEQFQFIFSAVLTQYILGFTRSLSVLLQSTTCDLIKAHSEARNLVTVLSNTRTEEKFKMLFQRATKVAQAIGVSPSKPRTAARQMHRANATTQSRGESGDDSVQVFNFYRLNYYYPFLDHVIQHMNDRFPEGLKGALLGTLLIPGNLGKLTPSDEDKIKNEFMSELPMPQSFEQEVSRWRAAQRESNTTSLAESVACCDEILFPNISTILQLVLTLPVGSCSCERSFSSLRRLKTWCRSSMGSSRLNGLALAYVHNDFELKPLDILQLWDASGHRRIALAFKTY